MECKKWMCEYWGYGYGLCVLRIWKQDSGLAEDKTVGVKASYEMKDKIKDSELYIYKGLGHAAYDEAKDFNGRIYEFLLK